MAGFREIAVSVLQWGVEHLKEFQTLSAMTTVAAFLLGIALAKFRHIREMRRVRREYRRMLNPDVTVVEAHILSENGDHVELSVISWGSKHPLSEILHNPILERKVEHAAGLHEGFFHLDTNDQLLLMNGLEELITGNDASANLDALMGREVWNDQVLMCPVTWQGNRSAHLIRIVILDPSWMERLQDPTFVARIRPTRLRYQYRAEWLHKIAVQWQKERLEDPETACMRFVTIHSQLLA